MKIGDLVSIEEKYDERDSVLRKIIPVIRRIRAIQETVSFGNIYLVEDKEGKPMAIWYYEKQLTRIPTDEETLWRTWGDI